ncbi:MAG: tetratricopeptide repeat protein, partial [Planctomycetota bacterium]
LEEMTESLETATIIFPFGSIQHLQRFLPLLHPEGALILSDKGYPDASWMKGEEEVYVQPSIHGNSLAHPVHFPLLESCAKNMGYRTLRTTNRKYYLQSMIIFPLSASLAREANFREQFMNQNLNQEAELFWLKAFEEKQKKDGREAKALLLECLKYRAQDCCLFYELGQLCLGLNEYIDALSYFQQGAPFNYFQEHDFYFNQGKAHLGLRDFSNALTAFQTSMKYFPSYHYSSYNIGLVYEGMKNYRQAMIFYQKALQPNPQNPQQLAPSDICMLVGRKRMFFLVLLPFVFILMLSLLILFCYWIRSVLIQST